MEISDREREQWAKEGVTLTEPDDDILEVRLYGEVMHRFSRNADPEEIRNTVAETIEMNKTHTIGGL